MDMWTFEIKLLVEPTSSKEDCKRILTTSTRGLDGVGVAFQKKKTTCQKGLKGSYNSKQTCDIL